jgi:hypothetical protein
MSWADSRKGIMLSNAQVLLEKRKRKGGFKQGKAK